MSSYVSELIILFIELNAKWVIESKIEYIEKSVHWTQI